MNIFLTRTLLGFACLGTAATSFAAPATDPIVASFERIMTEEKSLPAPASPTSASDDPLRQAISMFLWKMQPGTCILAGQRVGSTAPGRGS